VRQNVWLIMLLAALAIFGVSGALLLSLKDLGRDLEHEQEWVRALLQVGLITAVGIVTSGVLERFKDSLQQRHDDSKLRFDVLTELSRAYMEVKLVRRKVQAAGGAFTATETDLLNETQVLVELHMHNSVHLFKQKSGLEDKLKTMEDYLNKVANDANSKEQREFCSTEGFTVFAHAFHDTSALIKGEIAGR
jgi:hypothetical protein